MRETRLDPPAPAAPPSGSDVARTIGRLLGMRADEGAGSVWEDVAREIAVLVAGMRATIGVLDSATGRLRVLADVSPGAPDQVRPEAIAIGEGLLGHVFKSGEPVVVASYDDWPHRVAGIPAGTIGSAVGSPLIDAREVVHGVVAVSRDPSQPPFTDADEVVVVSCAAALATHVAYRQLAALHHVEVAHRLAAIERERAANRVKSEFFSRISHELRTPLNAVYGFTQLLELELGASPQAETIRYLKQGAEHLRGLIDHITDIERIERGKASMDIEPTPMRELLDPIVAILRVETERHGQRLELGAGVADDRLLAVDAARARQVLLNLGSNAVKFNRPGGVVRLRAQPLPGATAIVVEDTGLGIAADDLERVFEPFVRLPGPVHGAPGSGLGLSLARSTAEAMGGSLRVVSEEGIGSAFWFRLPDATPEAPLAP